LFRGGLFLSLTLMGLPLRITYHKTDILFELLTEKPSARSGVLEILLDGSRYRLEKHDKEWRAAGEGPGLDSGLANAIGKAMELRYRL
jgi:hypothetical protein